MSLIFTNTIKKYKKSLPERYFFQTGSNRTSLLQETPGYACMTGSMTVEAAVIVPLLACLFTFVLFFFRLMQIQLCVQNALENTGQRLSVYAAVKELDETEYRVIARSLFTAETCKDKNINKYVRGTAFGISFLESGFDGDEIRLRVNYQVKFPVNLLGKKTFLVSQQTIYRKWTGWSDAVDTENEDIWVYVAEHGEVYHKSSSCSYLNLSIQSVERSQIENLRNKDGEKYHMCEYCADKINKFGRVYITNYGNKYHTDLNCEGIKRTIEMVRLSEVGEMGACSKCWKE